MRCRAKVDENQPAIVKLFPSKTILTMHVIKEMQSSVGKRNFQKTYIARTYLSLL